MLSSLLRQGTSFIFKHSKKLAVAGSLTVSTSSFLLQSQRSKLSTMTETLRTKVCIIGSGPAAHTAAICKCISCVSCI
eukprot:m.23797 g.23797  ORF g.23797 m.23797 type:complete len:78 (-) comp9030_c0_seq1:1304-1537(-)